MSPRPLVPPTQVSDLVREAIIAGHEERPMKAESAITDEQLINTLTVTKVATLLKIPPQNVYRVLAAQKRGKQLSFFDLVRLYTMLQRSLAEKNSIEAEILRAVIRQRYVNLLPDIFPEIHTSTQDKP